MAIITRWHMPPESWCGKAFTREAAAGMPTCSSSSMVRRLRSEALPERAHGKRLNTIPGVVPGIADRPTGCVFNPRCGFAQERCRVEQPALETKLGARVRCHFPVGGGAA